MGHLRGSVVGGKGSTGVWRGGSMDTCFWYKKETKIRCRQGFRTVLQQDWLNTHIYSNQVQWKLEKT